MSSPIIIHPCFQECQYYTLDQYWKDTFFLCACNKFPKGMRYDSSTRTLYVRVSISGNKTRTEAMGIPENPEEIYLVMMKIFKEKLNMFSSIDVKIRKEELQDLQSQKKIDLDCEWKKIKPRAIKDQMIINYVSFLKEENNLTTKEAKSLLSKIQLGFQLKKLTSDDVEYSERKIQSINGLEYDSEKRKWIITNEPKIVAKTEKVPPKQKFHQSIDKFVREYKSMHTRFTSLP